MTDGKAGGLGDINSTQIGTGARYNAGKRPLQLIPLRIIARTYREQIKSGPAVNYINALDCLGQWQEGGELRDLYACMSYLGGAKEVTEATAWVFDYGRKKYAEWNWAKGMPWSAAMACAARHIEDLILGEVNDHESNLPLIGHVGCNLVMLITYHRTYQQGDDRPALLRTPKTPASSG